MGAVLGVAVGIAGMTVVVVVGVAVGVAGMTVVVVVEVAVVLPWGMAVYIWDSFGGVVGLFYPAGIRWGFLV